MPWRHCCVGDEATHDRLVAHAITDAAARADVVVLAQASMARATAAMADWAPPVPVLTSPELALRQVGRILAGPPVERDGELEATRP